MNTVLYILLSFLLTESSDSAHVLSPSVVSASLERYCISPADTVSEAHLEAVSGIADAIRSFTGIQIKDYGGVGGLKTVNVRSLGSEHVGVFIDGIQVDNSQNMQVDLGRFSTDNISSVELYNGQRSATLQTAKEYGTAASIYLLSSRPVFSPGSRNNIKARVRSGSFGTFAPDISLEHLFSGHVSGVLNAGMVSSSGEYRFRYKDTVMTRKNCDVNSFRAEGQLFGNLWQAKAYYYDSERGLPGPVVRIAGSFPLSMDRETDRNMFFQGSYRKDLAPGNTLMLRGKYAYDFTRYRTDPYNDPQAMPYDNLYRQHEGYLSASDALSLRPWWTLQSAADLQVNYLDANLRDFVYPFRTSFFGALCSGVSWERFRLSGSLQYAMASDRFKNGSGGGFRHSDKTRNAFSPALLGYFKPFENIAVSFTGFAKRSYRMPSFNDLYYTLVGNSNLTPEDAWQYDLGARYQRVLFQRIRIDLKAEGYYNEVTDKIVAVPTSNQFRWSMYNIGSVHITGAEIRCSLDYSSGKGEKSFESILSAKYTYQDARDYSHPERKTYKGQIPYIPRHSGSICADIAWNGWRAEMSLIADGTRYSSSVNIEDYRIDPWYTCDICLSRRFKSLTLLLSLGNIFNEQYEIVQGYPMPGFNAVFTLSWTFAIFEH
jgi:vitamin B12 transporter